ncbi:hypothetical protein QVD17_12749 [Tagetes erecta]|uniref:Uncharacterized protein n=1 Tax=Tagetes erecta TaxID=13708 RepID=A0AAD8P2X0_TARER|nr:hypothetical protein QVD17_12749 [Tagetes erecta]
MHQLPFPPNTLKEQTPLKKTPHWSSISTRQFKTLEVVEVDILDGDGFYASFEVLGLFLGSRICIVFSLLSFSSSNLALNHPSTIYKSLFQIHITTLYLLTIQITV